MTRRAVLPLATAAVALGVAHDAAAATIAATRPCLNSRSPAQYVGTGFTPGRTVKVTSRAIPQGTAVAGPDGSVAVPATAPLADSSQPPQPFAFEASDGTNTAAGSTLLADPGVVLPSSGRTRVKMRIQLTGYEPGRRVYAHLRWNQKWQRTVLLGTAAGPCGTLVVSRKLLRKTSSFKLRLLYVQFDSRRKPATDTHQTAYAKFFVARGVPGTPETYRGVGTGWRERTGI